MKQSSSRPNFCIPREGMKNVHRGTCASDRVTHFASRKSENLVENVTKAVALADRCHKLRGTVLVYSSTLSQILRTKWISTHGYSNLVTSGVH
jgi:hypothetical protein